ncbi:MAG: hypothetical protein ACREI7_11390, partial [Myxococcota bacterium]
VRLLGAAADGQGDDRRRKGVPHTALASCPHLHDHPHSENLRVRAVAGGPGARAGPVFARRHPSVRVSPVMSRFAARASVPRRQTSAFREC